ncbi:hypothetical protein [Streptomyces sp. M92]|uniref:hypothetical protein n=1 Tax=Streptomyces sp. M92 TaxID=2944250 RepID=UPI00234A4B81|nr:hypothetical protein [Streptomyces sp. M92]WCN05835.1 hypothetical protein M6G08_29220 [Streptomyces sp. M92]
MRSVLPVLRGCLPPLVVHLLIGVPTFLTILCARWYAAHGHCGYEDLRRRDLDGCTYDQIEAGGFVLSALFLLGAFVLVLLLLYDLRPLRTGRPLGPRLLTSPAVLVPYAGYVMAGG